MIVDISLDCVGSQRPLWGTIVRPPRPLSLMFPYSRRVMIVLRWSLYSVVSVGRVLGLFVPLPPADLTGFPQGPNISLEAGFGRNVFFSAVFVVFHSRYQSTLGLFVPLPPAVLTGFPRKKHFVGSGFWTNCLSQCCVRRVSLTVPKHLDP